MEEIKGQGQGQEMVKNRESWKNKIVKEKQKSEKH